MKLTSSVYDTVNPFTIHGLRRGDIEPEFLTDYIADGSTNCVRQPAGGLGQC